MKIDCPACSAPIWLDGVVKRDRDEFQFTFTPSSSFSDDQYAIIYQTFLKWVRWLAEGCPKDNITLYDPLKADIKSLGAGEFGFNIQVSDSPIADTWISGTFSLAKGKFEIINVTTERG